MKIGMNLLLWTDTPTFAEHEGLIRTLRDWGFDGVEFPVAPMTRSDISAFSALCDSLNLGRSAILALDASNADPASADPRLRLAALEEIRSAIDKTAALGAQVLCGPLFQGLGRFSGAAPTDDELERAADVLRQAGEYAMSCGVSLALEPLNRFEMYIVNTMAQAAAFVRRIGLPNVGLLADTHHGNIEERDVTTAWRDVRDAIKHVHISENDRGTPGGGHAVPPDLFPYLVGSGYDGWLTIEAFGQSVPGLVSRLHLWRTFGDSEETIARDGLRFLRDGVNAARTEGGRRDAVR
ncbi:sugar phosphate isomerase/epimerase family protein [Cohnella sp. GCM10027633]|uniref:sugar phosphate isomerase/epimerase family protein n=1 Tax=unclassified Cohnella TaxID=2636738 RepID=UPI003628756A